MSVSPEEAALIQAVVADPDADTPRLVYADWLNDHDRPERARLIQVQCQIEQLRAEERALIAAHGREWGGPLFGMGADRWEFHRGFPEEVQIRFHDYVREVDRLNTVTPVRRLHLTGGGTSDPEADLAALGRLPAVSQLLALRLEDHHADAFGPGGIQALAASPHLTRLQELTLESPNADAGVVEVIASSPSFTGLRRLELPHPGADTIECTQQLLRSPFLRNLEWVRLGERPPFSPTFTRRVTPELRPAGDGPTR